MGERGGSDDNELSMRFSPLGAAGMDDLAAAVEPVAARLAPESCGWRLT